MQANIPNRVAKEYESYASIHWVVCEIIGKAGESPWQQETKVITLLRGKEMRQTTAYV